MRSKHKYLAIIICNVSFDECGAPMYLRKISGKTIIQIMAERVSNITAIGEVALYMREPDRSTDREARKSGWLVFWKKSNYFQWLHALYLLLKYRKYVVFNLMYPFPDIERCENLCASFERKNTRFMYVKNGFEFAPRYLISNDFAVRAGIHKLFSRTAWLKILKEITLDRRSDELSLKNPLVASSFTAETVTNSIIEIAGGTNFSVRYLLTLEKRKGFNKYEFLNESRDFLHHNISNSPTPHLSNLKLNTFERENSFEVVKSFPYDIALNISNLCNAGCLFCNYQPPRKDTIDFLTLDRIKKMTWLKYVCKLGFGGSIGDPLMNPEFEEIYRYLKRSYPHLITRIITNGISLTEEMCRMFAGNLDRIRISLNSPVEETWETIMQSKGFDRICNMISLLSDLKSKLRTQKPEIIILMVIARENIEETVKMVELSHKLGAQILSIDHFDNSIMDGCNMKPESSLYFDRKKSDLWLDRAEKIADELGLKLLLPQAFREEKKQFFMGEAVSSVPKKCYNPWTDCYLLNETDNGREMDICCSGYDVKIRYNNSHLTKESFQKLWNHPTLQYFRRSVNNIKKNPVCISCRGEDHINPESRYKERLDKEVGCMFSETNKTFLDKQCQDT